MPQTTKTNLKISSVLNKYFITRYAFTLVHVSHAEEKTIYRFITSTQEINHRTLTQF